MAKILAIDYGTVRTGIAISDETKTFAFGLPTVSTKELFSFLSQITVQETISTFIIGEPKQMNGLPSESETAIASFIEKLTKSFPKIPICRVDERFTSKMAFDVMIASGMKKKQRQNKGKIDEISAVIILQTYLDNH